MAADDGTVQIRSFRVCFRVERRIHRVDRWRIPLPYGMPVRGLAYGAVILLAVVVGGGIPVVSDLLGLLHPIIRYGALPVAGGYLLTELKVDGRTGHAVVRSWVRMRLAPRRLAGCRAAPPPGRVRFGSIAVAPDERGPRLRPGVVEGRGRVVLVQPAALRVRGRALHVEGRSGPPQRRGRQINLRPGQRVVIA